MQRFEIYRGTDSKKYLVFLLSIVKVSMAYDEELMLQDLEVGLEMTPGLHRNSFFQSSSEYKLYGVLATAVVLVSFLCALYHCILPEHIRDSVFGVSNKKAAEPSKIV